MVVGEGKCCVCWGSCCPLVNCAINTLVRVGELNEDAEVSVMCYCVLKIGVIQSVRDALTAFTLKLENLKIVAGLVGNQVCVMCANIVCIMLL